MPVQPQDPHVRQLLREVLSAHGGLERWSQVRTVRATIVTGGSPCGMEGLMQDRVRGR
ncbi:hypothetical protein QRN89_31555 [Streptomyces chengbuensis]|uniref:hypothetical protein n=1 Tax=Streptomyces TaxID=1883 RepID=UPI0025B54650|nr:hypothetical protein [Streptomyces sp. HUAS CB01]WJY53942.1 hypothetical protein QRN89_31555 [Streptomyces sp. HUAS CB01]